MANSFRPTENVITADGEWVAIDELAALHARPLRCGSCHIPVVVTQSDSGWQLIHRPGSEMDRKRVSRCRYRASSSLSTGIRGF